jgi:DNA-binding transcriptional ArsR family regulator
VVPAWSILADFGVRMPPQKKRVVEMANKLIDRDEDILQASLAMKAIAHPLRLKILCVLADNELSVQDIVDSVGTSQSNISQHLAILRDKEILATRKDANRVYYRIGDQRTLKLVGMMRDVFCSI